MIGKKKLYAISFTEGASVMAAEICGAKLLSPFFGSSLYVWSSVMAITLGGLAAGYFLGGKLSKRSDKELTLLFVLLAAVVCLCLMPFLSSLFYNLAGHFSLIPAVILSVFIILFPTMLGMGATSPLIIAILTHHIQETGENSGKIYAMSTLGGIIATFLCGFYLIPTIGVKLTLIVFAMVLAGVCFFLWRKGKAGFLFLIVFVMLCFVCYGFSHAFVNKHTIYQKEGIMGKLEVRDEPSLQHPSSTIRKLLINTTVQTEMDLLSGQSVSEYVAIMEHNMPFFPKGKALVLGLGGGVVSNMLTKYYNSVTAVEFDARIIEVAKTFFSLNPSIKTVHQDARYFINSCSATYDLLLFDIFKAEEQPSHVLTKESLIKLKQMLLPNGMIIINTHGYLTGVKGLGTHCLLATLKQAGFHSKLCTYSNNEDYRNLLIVASLKPLDKTLLYEMKEPFIVHQNLINTDDKPVLEKLNVLANQAWRTNYLKNYILEK